MENPATWGEAEKIIQGVYLDWLENTRLPASERVTGLSLYRQIADALREAGLLRKMSYESVVLMEIRDELKQIRELLTPGPAEIHIPTGLSLTAKQITELVRLVKAQTKREKDED